MAEIHSSCPGYKEDLRGCGGREKERKKLSTGGQEMALLAVAQRLRWYRVEKLTPTRFANSKCAKI